MSSCLRDSSLVDRVFVSYSCNACDSVHSRYKNQETTVEDGNTQDMLRFINNNRKVCLVALDHAGLSTNRKYLHDNENLKMILVDTLLFNNKVTIYEREKLLKEEQLLKAFECRSRPYQRFK
ncbi:hypothetical protein BDB01DRAFT_728374 [Pilobolus umbonatus]|nr:hypothetical protein BDB01DRAFT_728374 [Pilobolus umbonatus]